MRDKVGSKNWLACLKLKHQIKIGSSKYLISLSYKSLTDFYQSSFLFVDINLYE